jgi:hypothetical protein
MKRSRPVDRGGSVERTSEWERSGTRRGGSQRWEGDRVDRDRETEGNTKLAIGSNRRGERGSERDRESRDDQQEGRNTTPREDCKFKEYDRSAQDRDQERKEKDGRSDQGKRARGSDQDGDRDRGGDRGIRRRYTDQRPFRDEENREHFVHHRQRTRTIPITPQHRQLQQQICSCKSLLQLLETVERAEDMDHVNVSTAIHRSAKHFKQEAKIGRTRALLDDSRFQRSF